MSTREAKLKYKQLLSQLGKEGLNALFPDDFEYYLCSFELRNSKDKLKSMFVFPVNPELLRERENNAVNVIKTLNGITTITNPTFIPVDISLSGTFGRKMRVLLGNNSIDSTAFVDLESTAAEFFPSIKTGYGTFKKLQKLLQKSKTIDPETRLPYNLYFFNYALNTGYLVEFNTFVSDNTIAKNAMWYYTLQMTALSPVKIKTSQRLLTITTNIAQNGVNLLASDLKNEMKNASASANLFG